MEMHLNIYTLPQLASVIFNVFVLVLLLKSSKDHTLKKLAIFFIISTTFWQLSHMLILSVDSYSLAYALTKIGYIGTIFVALLYGDFIYYAGNGKRLPFLILLIRLSCLFLPFILFSNYFVNGLWRYDVGFYPKAGILHPIHLIMVMVALIYTWFKILHNIRIKYQPSGNRAVVIALSIMFWGTLDYLPNYGIEIPILGWIFSLAGFSYIVYSSLFRRFADIGIVNDRLEQLLRERTAELEARNEELDAFAHTVAHDLKNPLGLVIGYADLLVEDHATLSPTDRQQAAQTIWRTGQQLDRIIEELLLLAGVRKRTVIHEPIAMADIVNEACARLRLLIQDTQALIVVPEATAWPAALGYAPWLEEVWTNYLSNALKYGGQPPQVEVGWDIPPTDEGQVESEAGQMQIRFWVRDNGPGLTPEAQAELFKPFRLQQTHASGHGLGLSIVRRIVEKLDGQVGVESAQGQGSLFCFTLPAAASDLTSPQEKREAVYAEGA